MTLTLTCGRIKGTLNMFLHDLENVGIQWADLYYSPVSVGGVLGDPGEEGVLG